MKNTNIKKDNIKSIILTYPEVNSILINKHTTNTIFETHMLDELKDIKYSFGKEKTISPDYKLINIKKNVYEIVSKTDFTIKNKVEKTSLKEIENSSTKKNKKLQALLNVIPLNKKNIKFFVKK